MEKSERTGKPRSSQLNRTVPEVSRPAPAYADGAPLDRVQYLEAKLILKPDRFTSVQSFRDFGKIVRRTAKQVGKERTSSSHAGSAGWGQEPP